MKNIKLIIFFILVCCTNIACQKSKNVFFYNCNQILSYKREFDTGDTVVVDTIKTTISKIYDLKNSKVLLIFENLFPMCSEVIDKFQPCRSGFYKELLVVDTNSKRIYKSNPYELHNENELDIRKEKILSGNYTLLDSVYSYKNTGSSTSFNGKEKEVDKIYFMPYVNYTPLNIIKKEDINSSIFLEAEFPQLISRNKELKTFRRNDRHEGATNISLDSNLCIKQFSYFPNLGYVNEYKFTLLNDCCKP